MRKEVNPKLKYEITLVLLKEVFASEKRTHKKEHLNIYLDEIETALRWATKNGNALQISAIEIILLRYYDLFKMNTKLIILGEKIIKKDIFNSLADEHYAYAYLQNAYKNIGNYAKYIELVPITQLIYKKLFPNLENAHKEFENMAAAYYGMKQYETAIVNYHKCIQLITKEGEEVLVSSLYNNIGLAYQNLKEKDSALTYFNIAHTLMTDILYERRERLDLNYELHFIDVIKLNIVGIEIDNGNYNSQIQTLKKIIKPNLYNVGDGTYFNAMHLIAKTHYLKKEYAKALNYIGEGLLKLNFENNKDTYIAFINLKAKIYLATNKQEESELLFDEINKIEQEIAIEKSKRSSYIAAAIYETNKKEQEIQDQQSIVKAQNNEIAAQKAQRDWLIIGTIILLVILLTLYYFLRKVKNQRNEIERQKLLAEASLKEKELLLKEVHHRVKNNLQIISSLMNKQGKKSNIVAIKALMDEAQNRIKSMAMIHQKLYQNQDFRNIDIKSYTEELAKSIAVSYKPNGVNINLKLEMIDVNFHIDIAVPLGLILNELLTNAYKHAFIGQSEGTVLVSITKLKTHQYKMQIIDDGIGLPTDMDKRIKKSLGMNLVEGLSWQLRESFTYKIDHGSIFTVLFTDNLKTI